MITLSQRRIVAGDLELEPKARELTALNRTTLPEGICPHDQRSKCASLENWQSCPV